MDTAFVNQLFFDVMKQQTKKLYQPKKSLKLILGGVHYG
jgi:hypothetical protein